MRTKEEAVIATKLVISLLAGFYALYAWGRHKYKEGVYRGAEIAQGVYNDEIIKVLTEKEKEAK